jgi:hypothetical protein
MEPDTKMARSAPWPWSSEGGDMDNFYKLAIAGSLIIGLSVFLLAYTGHLSGQPPLACMVLGVIVMSLSGLFAYLLIKNQFKPVDDWLITYVPPEPETYYKVLAATEAYLKNKKLEYKSNPDLEADVILDPQTKEPLMEEFLLDGLVGPQLRISNMILDTKHIRFGYLEIHNVTKENFAHASKIATELLQAISEAGIEYDEPRKKE